MKILFVCLGNICRSPTAEAVFRKKASTLGLNYHFDSAGTAGYHIGEKSDPRSIKHAEKRGYEMKHLARQVQVADFHNFDLIFAMDHSNLQNLIQIAHTQELQSKVKLLTEYSKNFNSDHVPDPYYGSSEAFEHVLDLVEDCADHFFHSVTHK